VTGVVADLRGAVVDALSTVRDPELDEVAVGASS